NVVAIAWTIHVSGLKLAQITDVGFYVLAPEQRIREEPTFNGYLAREAISEKATRRAALYADDSAATQRLSDFTTTTLEPMLDRIVLRAVSWEELIDATDTAIRPSLETFYEACLIHNRYPKSERDRTVGPTD
ncbi:MAG TPA: hypothetical protein VFY15_06745, partial [Acidimicrobiia bacterium]|nr:hypothetical protein [Acidimicrobiia bacterium]